MNWPHYRRSHHDPATPDLAAGTADKRPNVRHGTQTPVRAGLAGHHVATPPKKRANKEGETVNRYETHLIQVGSVVTKIGQKTRATVIRDLYKPHAQNRWGGWVEVAPALSGFTRYHRDELELVK
jgi:hypothetical protein